ncbi:MAG: dephospho-CoA kinase, partial [Clostridia bacterium]|nr:dephospho-CoA kinase [Clostridia bacterium]
MKIGLTGSIACGKSTVSAYLKSMGHVIVDADAISHSLTAPGGAALPRIREAFGDGIFDGDVLNRHALGSIVFE